MNCGVFKTESMKFEFKKDGEPYFVKKHYPEFS